MHPRDRCERCRKHILEPRTVDIALTIAHGSAERRPRNASTRPVGVREVGHAQRDRGEHVRQRRGIPERCAAGEYLRLRGWQTEPQDVALAVAVEDARSRLLLKPFARVPPIDAGPRGELSRRGRRIPERRVEPKAGTDMDG